VRCRCDPLKAYLTPAQRHLRAAEPTQRRHTSKGVYIPPGVPELALLTDAELETLTTVTKIVRTRATLAKQHGIVIVRHSTARSESGT
jgi:hypothetical protein